MVDGRARVFVTSTALETFEKVVLRLPPSAVTVAMIATEMPAAIKPYSIAVARLFVSARNSKSNASLIGHLGHGMILRFR